MLGVGERVLRRMIQWLRKYLDDQFPPGQLFSTRTEWKAWFRWKVSLLALWLVLTVIALLLIGVAYLIVGEKRLDFWR